MGARLSEIVVDCHDPEKVPRFWSAVLDWPVRRFEEPDEIYFDLKPPSDEMPEIAFVPVPEPKTAKVRIHLDVRPTEGSTRDEEVERILGLGATRVDVGQSPDVTWVVLADVEGNEFCVLRPASDPSAQA